MTYPRIEVGLSEITHKPFVGERKMAAGTVNLDALVPRDDFNMDDEGSMGNLRSTISLTDLDNGFFSNSLRKPDFQRETTNWSPQKIVDLVKAFLDGDLIPAVILWQRGSRVFAIDGAHRLSALMAWLKDDYGDGVSSIKFFGPNIPDEQLKIAEKTRKLMKNEVGRYAEFQAMSTHLAELSSEVQAKVARLGSNSLVAQWVTKTDPRAAEASFFKINQAAQPIDTTERRILQSRQAANGIAARCIVRAGKGHKYWASFNPEAQGQIEEVGNKIFEALYTPALREPIKTLDMPVAGQGYNALPFIFNLVNLCNDLPLPKSASDKKIVNPLADDVDGTETLAFLKKVEKRISLVTTNHPGSLGFHPAVYFYAMSGKFLANAFLASLEFAKELDQRRKKNEFCEVRGDFENYLFQNKVYISLTVTKLGSGARSLTRLKDLYWRIFEYFSEGLQPEEITERLFNDQSFSHLRASEVPPPHVSHGKSSSGRQSGATKSAAYIREGMANVIRCSICEGAIHANSLSSDHVTRVEDGGGGHSSNAGIAHPYCNTGFKN